MFETFLTIDKQFVISKVKLAKLGKLTRNRHGDDEKISITKELQEEILMLNTTLVSLDLNYFHRIKREISLSSQEVCKSWIQEKKKVVRDLFVEERKEEEMMHF